MPAGINIESLRVPLAFIEIASGLDLSVIYDIVNGAVARDKQESGTPPEETDKQEGPPGEETPQESGPQQGGTLLKRELDLLQYDICTVKTPEAVKAPDEPETLC
ncbi:DNA/RNA non-specific endonuclease domain-containing protein, putative [Eimeria praecox]|uniref:DNA/RNA non-specific endonuclease domain-containing protein, putative n=1 Tax=Eimeria praecox TaxID=51316 RepID=U6G5Y2_9EIME|nr:DNA/RNA non-specific endonuclease domain-containing protein, putative [Eimeria praecox]